MAAGDIYSEQIPLGSIDLFGPGAVFHHVGIAVRKMNSEQFPADQFPTVHAADPTQQVKVAFAHLNGTVIEFIEPDGPQSPVAVSLKKGMRLVHICFSVPDIDAAIEFAVGRGLMVISPPVPAVAFNNRKIAWLAHEILGLFELVESPR